jgi:hypothetical protein
VETSGTFRNGQPLAVAVDIIAFMVALKIEKATLAGFDRLHEPSRVFSINPVKFGDLESNGVLGDLTHSFLFLG